MQTSKTPEEVERSVGAQEGRERPVAVWRGLATIAALLTACGVVAEEVRRAVAASVPPRMENLVDWALAAVWILAGAWALTRARHRLAHERDRRAAAERRLFNVYLNVVTVVGWGYVLLLALSLLHVNLSGLLVGGAVTGLLVGIAAQSALGNLFGGLVVLLLHPYDVGQRVTLRSPAFGGVEYSGTVREVNLFYTTLETGPSRLVIPNGAAVAAVARIDGSEAWETLVVPVPLAVAPDRLRAALAARGLDHDFAVEGVTGDGYTLRVQVPAGRGPAVLIETLAELKGNANPASNA
jgi:small conductance mechanosensitive channel